MYYKEKIIIPNDFYVENDGNKFYREQEEIKIDENKWTPITFIDSISLSENGKTINYTTKTIEVLTYGNAISGQGSFDIKE